MNPSMSLPGAVAGDPPDGAVAAHFGDPAGEQRAAERDLAVVDRGHRGVVVVEGPERLAWLHQLTSQSLDRLAPGVPTETLVLSPHGHVEQHAELVDDGQRCWLLVEPGAAPGLAGWLDSMRFMTRVEVRDVSEQWATLTLLGPRAEAAAAGPVAGAPTAAGAPTVAGVPTNAGAPTNAAAPPSADGPAPAGPAGLLRPRRWPSGAVDLLVRREEAAGRLAALAAAGARPAGHLAFEALRVAAGAARLHLDTDHRTLVHEVGWVGPAVHLEKGCYRGQETVARVHNLGRPPRRLLLLHLDGSGVLLPPRGTPLLAGGRQVGALTSVARHFELGPIGLALVKGSVPPDAELLATPEEGEPVAVAVERDLSSPTAPVDLSGFRGGR